MSDSSIADELESVYQSRYAGLHAIAAAALRDDEEAHDVVQEVFARLLARGEGPAGRAGLWRYLVVSVLNAARDGSRRRRNRSTREGEWAAEQALKPPTS